MNEPTQGETRELIDAIKELVPLLSRAVADAPAHPPLVGGVHQIMMAPPTNDERSAHKAEKVAVGLACLLIGLLIGGWSMISDMSADARDLKRGQQRTDDYLNMLWRTYPETREAALKAQEDSKNGQPHRN